MTTVPSACRLSALAPAAIVIGATPKTKASPVMTIGRKRMRQASMVASLIERPCSRKAFANSMMRNAVLRGEANYRSAIPTVK